MGEPLLGIETAAGKALRSIIVPSAQITARALSSPLPDDPAITPASLMSEALLQRSPGSMPRSTTSSRHTTARVSRSVIPDQPTTSPALLMPIA